LPPAQANAIVANTLDANQADTTQAVKKRDGGDFWLDGG